MERMKDGGRGEVYNKRRKKPVRFEIQRSEEVFDLSPDQNSIGSGKIN